MKKLLFSFLLCPLLSVAQNASPRFENDTLYTSGGYKIYKGQVLHLGSGTSEAGYFRFIKFHSSMGRNDTYSLQNSSILVNKIKNFKGTGPDNYNIRIACTVTFKNNSRSEADLMIDFEKAIGISGGPAGELTVPEEFKSIQTEPVYTEPKKQAVPEEIKKQPVPDELKKLLVADEIKKLFDLYKAGALTKEEYEARKKKLLEQ